MEVEVCRANIGPRERRRRLGFGIFGFGVAVVAAIVLAVVDAGPLLRATVFLPLALGAYGFFQYREKT